MAAGGDDLTLEVVIRALLDAKGFEQAQANVKNFAGAANKAGETAERVGKQQKVLGESFGGSRGPVADVTRVLLQNVGVTGAAGEAAKAAGTAMFFMEGAASASAVAMTAGVAALALLVPLMIRWFNASDETAQKQREIRDSLLGELDAIQSYVKAVPNASKAMREWASSLQAAAISKQADDIEQMRKKLKELEDQSAKKYGGPGIVITPEILAARDAIRAMAQAQAQGVTVAQQLTAGTDAERRAHDAAAAAAKAHADAVDDLAAIEQRQAQQELDSIAAAIDAKEQFDKDVAKDLAAEGKRQNADYKKRLKAETEYQLAVKDLKERGIAIDRQVLLEHQLLVGDQVSAAGAALGAFSSLFGRNKALAIAGAIADTYAAATKAFYLAGGYPLGIAPMVATIAQGLVNVQAIRQSGSAVGFDDPFSDMVARKLGRKSAQDFAKYFGGQFMGELPGAMVQNITNHRTTINRGTTNNWGGVHGLMANSPAQFLRALERVNVKAERFRRRTTVGR